MGAVIQAKEVTQDRDGLNALKHPQFVTIDFRPAPRFIGRDQCILQPGVVRMVMQGKQDVTEIEQRVPITTFIKINHACSTLMKKKVAEMEIKMNRSQIRCGGRGDIRIQAAANLKKGFPVRIVNQKWKVLPVEKAAGSAIACSIVYRTGRAFGEQARRPMKPGHRVAHRGHVGPGH